MKSDKIVKFPDSAFSYENGAEENRVFLWKNVDHPPFLVPVKGWKIIGYGKAPWPGSADGHAVMFEKTEPASSDRFCSCEDAESEGTRIWQHGLPIYVPGQPGYESLYK